MKRQESVSSSRRELEASPENRHAKNIGCMSGIFQLLYKSNNRRRFLTIGKRQEKNTVSSPKKSLNSVTIIHAENSKEENRISTTIQRFSCDVPRSPTLPSEIRRSNSVNSPENFRAPPALVARLMGLEEGPAMTHESAAEKRRKLLRALERCDEDLMALKKIIEVVKTSVNAVDGEGDSGDESIKRCSSSTVVVPHHRQAIQDELARPAVSQTESLDAKRHVTGGVMTQQQQQRQQRRMIKPVEEGIANISFIEKMMPTEWVEAKASGNIRSGDDDYYDMWNDKVMIETVNEVCRDIVWGEKREIGRIGLALYDRIWRDLIDEIVGDFKCFLDVHYCSLPLEACRKRLRF